MFLKIPCFSKYVFFKILCFPKYVFLKIPCFPKHVFFKNPCFQKTRDFKNPCFIYYKYNLVLNVWQTYMATQQDVWQTAMAKQQDVLARHCVVIELHRADEERILKYLYEHVYSYQWILREDKEIGMVRLCVWWREGDYKQFSTSPLRSFLKRLKNKAGYEKMSISKTLTTKEGVHVLCNGDLQCISKYYAEGPLYVYLREVLSLEPPQMVESSPRKEKCNHILQMASSLDMSTKLDLLQKFTSTIVPQVKRELDFYQRVPEEKPCILPDPPSPLITEPGSPCSIPRSIPIVSELDVFLPTFPSSPRSESY